VPPLLEEELLLLLLTGHPPKTGATQAATHAAGMNVAVYVGKGMLARLFSDQSAESDESVLDRFEVEIGRGVTRAGQETIDAQFRLAEGVVRDGDVLYITTEKDVYDDVNAGLKIVFRFK
jgi:translocation and assembly module TamB